MKKGFLLISLIVSAILVFSSCNTAKQIKEYLEPIEHNENMVFADDHYVYFHNNKIEHDVKMNVEHITRQDIYYSTVEKENVLITKYDINVKETTNVISFEGDKNSIEFYNDWIKYDTSNGSKLFSLKELKEYDYNNELIQKENSIYTYIDGNIVNNSTNEKKKIEFNDSSKIYNTVEAEHLKQLGASFNLEFVKIYREKIYVVVGNDYFIDTVYLYDFETEEFTYLDWNENTNGRVNLFVLE